MVNWRAFRRYEVLKYWLKLVQAKHIGFVGFVLVEMGHQSSKKYYLARIFSAREWNGCIEDGIKWIVYQT